MEGETAVWPGEPHHEVSGVTDAAWYGRRCSAPGLLCWGHVSAVVPVRTCAWICVCDARVAFV